MLVDPAFRLASNSNNGYSSCWRSECWWVRRIGWLVAVKELESQLIIITAFLKHILVQLKLHWYWVYCTFVITWLSKSSNWTTCWITCWPLAGPLAESRYNKCIILNWDAWCRNLILGMTPQNGITSDNMGLLAYHSVLCKVIISGLLACHSVYCASLQLFIAGISLFIDP